MTKSKQDPKQETENEEVSQEDNFETESDSQPDNAGQDIEQESESTEENMSEAQAEQNLEEALAQAQAKAEENWEKVLRAQADLDNMRRRSKIDVENAHKYGVEKFAKELLSVIDSLERGLEVSTNKEEADKTEHAQLEAMLEGMALTHKLLLTTLEKFGIKEINPVNESFDPTCHEAMSMQPNGEVEPNTVLQVVQKGYMQHDRTLRPALVVVAKSL